MKLLLGLAVASLLALAGCGGGGTKTSASTTTTTVAGAAARQAYRNCLQQHGVTLPARGQGQGQPPDSAPPSTLSPAMQSARQACASLRPAGGFGGGFGGGAQANNPQNQAYRNCLQQHGVTFSTSPSGGFNFNDPTFQAARQACASLRPTFGSTTTTTG